MGRRAGPSRAPQNASVSAGAGVSSGRMATAGMTYGSPSPQTLHPPTRGHKILAVRVYVELRGQVPTQSDAFKFNSVDPPTIPTAPSSPNRLLLLSCVLLVRLLGGVGVAFGLALLKTTFATAPRLEAATGLPVIGSVGLMLNDAERALRMRRLRLFVGGTAALGIAYVALRGVEFLQRGLAA